MRRVNVVGLGYIGLPTALMLAESGNAVFGTDINSELIEKLSNNSVEFVENGMEELYASAIVKEISFSEECVEADVYIVSVPTPYEKDNKRIDPSFVVQAVKSVTEVCSDGAIIAIESTIPPGTIDMYIRPIVGNRKVNLAHVPERIIPGSIIRELRDNNRTIGVDDEESGMVLKKIYGSFCRGELIVTDIRTAEMSKVVENTYRDINIAFANELTKICEKANINPYEVIRIANMHPRVNILTPGPGVGGHCISVDPWFLVGDYPGLANIILAARKINDSMPEYVLNRVSAIMEEKGIIDLGEVGFYGLTYKENVDDTRESPTLQLVDCMKNHLAKGAIFYDPYVNHQIVDGQVFTLDEFLKKTKLVVVMVGHDEIIENQKKLLGKTVFDTRNVIEQGEVYHL